LLAIKTLNNEKGKYNIFEQNNKEESITKNEYASGPGLYNLDNRDFWYNA